VKYWNLTLWRVSTNGVPRLIGTATGTLRTYQYMATWSLYFINQATIHVNKTTGEAKSLRMSGGFNCSGKCSRKLGHLNPRTLPTHQDVTVVGGVEPSLAKGTAATINSYWTLDIWNASPLSTTAYLDAYSVRTRCDNQAWTLKGEGCVVPWFDPLLTYSKTGKYPEVARHIEKALKSGLEGSAAHPLHRTTSKALAKKNGKVACPGSLKRPKKHTCDEYPFRSTKEGAASGGKARVFSGCHLPTVKGSGKTGFSRCMVLGSQNSGAGGVLGGFYQSNRVANGGAFRVSITK